MKFLKMPFSLLLICLFFQQCNIQSADVPKSAVWTKEEANNWYQNQEWLLGANFIPSTAINQLEMWQEGTFDTITIDRELGWAQSLGMNTARVYLHDLPHLEDSTGFYNRINRFLELADRHDIKPLFVFFDSCWNPYPQSGKQPDPKPHVHNSGWVQSPGLKALQDTTEYGRLERYIKGVVGRFRNDERILAWDIWNEPENRNVPSYHALEPANKDELVLPLLKNAFVWARAMNPVQPLTSAVWTGDWSAFNKMTPVQKVQIEQSDIISFHHYGTPGDFEEKLKSLQQYEKPVICTEYMARPNGSTFKDILPIAQKYSTGMYNWGFVSGKTQTIYPWDSWTKQYTAEPPLWFHDIFRKDGSPYNPEEIEIIKSLQGESLAVQ